MPKAIKIFMIIAMVGAILGVVVAGILYMRNQSDETTGVNGAVNEQVNSNGEGGTTSGTDAQADLPINVAVNTGEPVNAEAPTSEQGATAPTAQDDRSTILSLARVFIERYGSYSNESDYENIINLAPYMTAAFEKKSQEFIAEQKKKSSDSAERYGISTTAASLELIDYVQGSSAVARVATRRIETKGTADPTIFTQYVVIDFKNVEGAWKVQDVTWE